MKVLDKKDLKIERILEMGMKILWSKGYTATSVNDIVAAAGVPKGSFYAYFDSKDDFIIKALDKYFKEVSGPALAILNDKTHTPKERIVSFYDFRINMLKEDLQCERGCMACNLASEVAEHNEVIREKVSFIHKKISDNIVKIVREAQKQGQISKDIKAKDMVEFIEDACKGAMISMKETKSAYPIDNVRRMLDLLFLS